MSWGTWWELLGNLMGTYFLTHWEPKKNQNKISTPKEKKTKSPWVHAEPFSLAIWNFYFQNCLSPFLNLLGAINPIHYKPWTLTYSLTWRALSRSIRDYVTQQHLPMHHHPFVNQLWLSCGSSNPKLVHPVLFTLARIGFFFFFQFCEVIGVAIIHKRT
jgi:hypothetical protein